MRFSRSYIASMQRGDENGATGVSPLSYKEPLIGVEPGVDIVWEVIREDCRDCCDCVVREREASLRRSRHQFVREGPSCT